MRIKRFNENQQYLTEPLDPDTKLLFEIDFNHQIDMVEHQFKKLADNLGLRVYFAKNKNSGKPDCFFTNETIIKRYYWRDETEFLHYSVMLSEGNGTDTFKDIESLRENLIEFFEL